MKLTRQTTVAAALGTAVLGAAAAGVVAHASANVKTINVTEREFKITLSPKKGTVGTVQFVIKNTGKYTHGLEISGPGVKAKRAPFVKPGKTGRLTVTLKAGTYTLWCPVPGHAAEGMKTTLTVPGAAGGGSPPATTTTSGGGGGGGDAWS